MVFDADILHRSLSLPIKLPGRDLDKVHVGFNDLWC